MVADALTFLLTFACGAAYECACVFWVHHAEAGRARIAALFSMLTALVTVIGVEGFIAKRVFAVAYVLGFGMGTWLAIKIKAARAVEQRVQEQEGSRG